MPLPGAPQPPKPVGHKFKATTRFVKVGHIVELTQDGIRHASAHYTDTVVLGVATETGTEVEVEALQGKNVAVQFDSAPEKRHIGTYVYLSHEPGKANHKPPLGSNKSTIVIGILLDADGSNKLLPVQLGVRPISIDGNRTRRP